MPQKPADFTDKEWMFVAQYFIHNLNGTEAAMNSYDCKDRSVASVVASELLAKPKIRAHVEDRLAVFHLSANQVLARLSMQAMSSMEDFIDDSGSLDVVKAKRAKQLHLLKKFKSRHIEFSDKQGNETITTEVELELHDAQAALVHIGKHLNLFSVDTNININLTNLSDEALMQLASGKKPFDVEMPR